MSKVEEILADDGLVGSGDYAYPAERQQRVDEKISLTDHDDKKKSQATVLIEIGKQYTLFHCPQQDAYAEITEQGIIKILPLRTKDFKEFLGHEYFKLTGKGANTTAISDALNTLEAVAKHNGDKHTVYLRMANLGEFIYLDMGCDKWRVIEIGKAGWRILDRSPVRFYRKRGITAFPEPKTGGDISQLKPFVNVETKDFKLLIAWLMSVLGGVKPYPVLILQGEQGTGKSTTCRILRALTDPSTVPLRAPPKETRDLLVSASNNYLVVLDNLSGLHPEISDCLCRLSTGGGVDVRSLYTDNEQLLIDIQRPILINGIDDIATRPDLASRSIIVELPPFETNEANKGSDEKTFYADFDLVKGQIFGALLTGLVGALANIETTKLANNTRMADFAKWVVAAEQGLGWQTGEFMNAYRNNQDHAIEAGIEASPVGMAIMTLVDKYPLSGWTGTPTELLNALENISSQNQIKSRSWPQSPKGLSNIIKRLMPSFRRVGIEIVKETTHDRLYKIGRVGFYPPQAPHPPQGTDGAASGGADSGRLESITGGSRADSKNLQASPFAASGGWGAWGGYSGTYPNVDDDVEVF